MYDLIQSRVKDVRFYPFHTPLFLFFIYFALFTVHPSQLYDKLLQ